MCEGQEDGPSGCPAALTVHCVECKTEWQCDDTDFPGPCPSCGRQYSLVDRCSRCPLAELDYRRAHSEAGNALGCAIDLEWDVKHLSIPWDEIDEESAVWLKILEQEREKRQEELMKRAADERNIREIHNRPRR